MNDLLIIEHRKRLAADSRDVARLVGKRHNMLLRDIRTYCEYLAESNFAHSDFFIKTTYRDASGKKNAMYYLTRKGCDMVANKLTGEKGVLFTAAYINRFYEMETALKSREAARIDFPQFTDAIKRIHEAPAPHHFSNECDLINRIVLGMTAKEYRERHDIPKGDSIRPYLTTNEIALIDRLQHADIGLLIAERDYSKRKMMLQWYLSQITQSRLPA